MSTDTTSLRRVLLLGTHGQFNVGDELLLQTFLRELGTDFDYQVNSYDPASTAASIDEAFMVDVFDTASGKWRLIQRIVRSDVVIFAGGSIVKELSPATQRWRYSTLLMVLIVVTFARRIGRTPVLLSNVGVGPLASRRGRFLAKITLAQANLVSTRDRASMEMCHRLGLAHDRVLHVPDAVFVNTAHNFETSRRHVDKGVRPLRIALNLNHDVEDEDVWLAFLENVRQALGDLAAQREIEIVALPMQSTFKDDNDLVVLREFLATVPVGAQFPEVRDHHDAAQIISEVDVVLAERLHAIVIATILGTPVVALPYSTKVTELAAELGLDERSFPVQEAFSAMALSRALDAASVDGDAEGARLRAHATMEQHQLVRYFESVRQWMATPTSSWSALRQRLVPQ